MPARPLPHPSFDPPLHDWLRAAPAAVAERFPTARLLRVIVCDADAPALALEWAVSADGSQLISLPRAGAGPPAAVALSRLDDAFLRLLLDGPLSGKKLAARLGVGYDAERRLAAALKARGLVARPRGAGGYALTPIGRRALGLPPA